MPAVKHVAMATAFSHGDSFHPVFDPGKRHDRRQQDCKGESPLRHIDSVPRLSYPHTVGIARRASFNGTCG